jgi:hypothetical protein
LNSCVILPINGIYSTLIQRMFFGWVEHKRYISVSQMIWFFDEKNAWKGSYSKESLLKMYYLFYFLVCAHQLVSAALRIKMSRRRNRNWSNFYFYVFSYIFWPNYTIFTRKHSLNPVNVVFKRRHNLHSFSSIKNPSSRAIKREPTSISIMF